MDTSPIRVPGAALMADPHALVLGHWMKGAVSVLAIAPRAVADHKYRAMAAPGLGSGAEFVRLAVGAGLLGPESSQAAAKAPRVSAA